MAGLTAARHLLDAGAEVTVFDKSRGVGGRLATRRSDVGAFDHGAPLVQGDGAGFAEAMDGLASAERHGDGWRGLPGMSGLLKPWLAGAIHVPGCRIVRIEKRVLVDETDARHGPFDAVIVAVPAPQALDLTGQDALAQVVMDPVWTVLAAWDGAGAEDPDPVAPLDKILLQRGPGFRWIAHARAEWSRANLERTKADIAAELLTSLVRALGQVEAPIHLDAHRWRYARVARPLGAPFLDCGDGVLAGGDWALGPDAGHAFASGRAMAREIASRTLSAADQVG